MPGDVQRDVVRAACMRGLAERGWADDEDAIAALADVHRGPLAGVCGRQARRWSEGVEWECGGVALLTRWEITDPREAWELLATREVIPLAWLDDPRRRFVCATCRGDGVHYQTRDGGARNTPYDCPACAGGMIQHPPTVAECVAFASDPAGVMTAEAIARQITGCERVVWRVEPRAQIEKSIRTLRGRPRWLLTPTHAQHAQFVGRRVFALRDERAAWTTALDHAAALLATGYALDYVTTDTVVLLAPPLGGAP